MDKKVSKEIGERREVTLPLGNESLNPRLQGGQAVPEMKKKPGELNKTSEGRNSTGELSEFPYEIKREGVEHR